MRNRHGSMVLVLGAILLALAGCANGNLAGAASSDASLSDLEVRGAKLDRCFSGSTLEYSAIVANSVTKADILATPSCNGSWVKWLPDPATATLVEGPNVFTAVVNAPDGTTTTAYSVTIYRANCTATVLSSVAGSTLDVEGATLAIYRDSLLVYRTRLYSNPQPLWLAEGTTYTVKANATGRAQDTREDIVGAAGMNIDLVCQPLETTSFPVESPIFESFWYTTAANPTASDAPWNAIASGSWIDFSKVTYLKVVISASTTVASTAWSGEGVLLGIDDVPSFYTLGATTMAADPGYSTSSWDPTTSYLTATSYFDITGIDLTSGSHSLDFVMYDRSNNRSQRDISVVNSEAANTSGADLSADVFVGLAVNYKIYGTNLDYLFSITPSPRSIGGLESGPIYYRSAVSFKLMTAASGGANVPILGFKVFRSDDLGSTWKFLDTVNYGAPSTGVSGTHSYYDIDSALGLGTDYRYKVVAFTDDAHVKESAATNAMHFLPPFTASLATPTDRKTVDISSSYPDFTFTISAPGLLDPAVSDYYYFAPVIREKTGTIVYRARCIYRLATGDLLFYYGSNAYSVTNSLGLDPANYIAVDPASGTITLKAAFFTDPNLASYMNSATYAALELRSGVTYEWDLFGTYTGSASTNVASYFYKAGSGVTSYSYADCYSNGQQTLNGWYVFTVR